MASPPWPVISTVSALIASLIVGSILLFGGDGTAGAPFAPSRAHGCTARRRTALHGDARPGDAHAAVVTVGGRPVAMPEHGRSRRPVRDGPPADGPTWRPARPGRHRSEPAC